ncbi:MAG TPA: hypothetical protein VNH18_11965 [Bryobacteraceae bacterium]|nr:hypothetical protein [Bryobacteraceae bacterium]
MTKSKQRRRKAMAPPVMELTRIECALARFFGEVGEGDLKLADYVRLADMESVADDGGSEDVRARWVNEAGETETET